MLISPFIAWSFYGIGFLFGKIKGMKAFNGASLYNWLTLSFVAFAALSNNPEGMGSLIAGFSVSWFVGRSLSKRYKLNAIPKQ